MTVLCLIAHYPPLENGGPEWIAHEFNLYLIGEKGFRVTVGCRHVQDASFQGVETVSIFSPGRLQRLVDQSDLIFSHLGCYDFAAYLARKSRKPIIHFVLNDEGRPALLNQPENLSRQYVVYTAEYIKQGSIFPQPSMVVRPPVDWRKYAVTTSNRCITLINVNEPKGGKVLAELARLMPDRTFLGVKGFRGEMVIVNGLPNLTYLDHTPEIRGVYSQTGILIVPSESETWGRVGVEAMASGIPVIAHPTPGLKESLSYAGLFCHRDKIEDWVAMIQALDNPDFRREVSERCLRRSRELDPTRDLAEFGQFMDKILAEHPAPMG